MSVNETTFSLAVRVDPELRKTAKFYAVNATSRRVIVVTEMGQQHTKVLLEYEGSDGLTEIESVWAEPVEEGYKIDNIPFYAHGIGLNDTIAVLPDPDGLLRFQEVLKPSGHSTIRLWFEDAGQVAGVRRALNERGCESELSDLPQLVAVDIPPSVDYSELRRYLDDGERADLFEYEEACLRH